MFQPERALAAVCVLRQEVRRGVFTLTASERHNLDDDLLLLEGDLRAVVMRRRAKRAKITSEQIAELRKEDEGRGK